MNVFGIVIWYAVCALIIKGVLWFYDLTNRPRFRGGSALDITTEVGYEEDPVGNLLDAPNNDAPPLAEWPHIQATK